MAKRVLLLGVMAALLKDVQEELQRPDIEFLGGTGVDDVRSAFRQADIDHVIVGGGLDLDARAEMVREIFQSSDRATIHLKDQMSGPEGSSRLLRQCFSDSTITSPKNRLMRSCGRGTQTLTGAAEPKRRWPPGTITWPVR